MMCILWHYFESENMHLDLDENYCLLGIINYAHFLVVKISDRKCVIFTA